MMTDFGENEENESLFSCVCIFMESDKDIMKVKVVLAISVYKIKWFWFSELSDPIRSKMFDSMECRLF